MIFLRHDIIKWIGINVCLIILNFSPAFLFIFVTNIDAKKRCVHLRKRVVHIHYGQSVEYLNRTVCRVFGANETHTKAIDLNRTQIVLVFLWRKNSFSIWFLKFLFSYVAFQFSFYQMYFELKISVQIEQNGFLSCATSLYALVYVLLYREMSHSQRARIQTS